MRRILRHQRGDVLVLHPRQRHLQILVGPVMLLRRRRRDHLKIDAHALHCLAARGDVEHQARQQLALHCVGGTASRRHVTAIGIVHRVVMTCHQRLDPFAERMGMHIDDGHASLFVQLSSAAVGTRWCQSVVP